MIEIQKLDAKKGKILRVKQGYNPNSSSIGSIVFAVPTMLLVSSAIFGTAAGVISAKFMKRAGGNKADKDEKASKEQSE
ncbi:hypothetical protein D1AOALGA4SA_3568 [Olavius algarvensis Delta 1 endosymbiont]|nr:hypothetical protein D1AOALGA4SA_3568 [Olavius algarvensis Delta 1 endosymbiont]